MNIKILDCTLRDGGYVNNWGFGEIAIKRIISKLSNANIDIIECGFLTTNGGDKNTSLFNDVSKIRDYIGAKNKDIMYVAMIAYPNNIVVNIPECDGNSIDGIRVTFHEHEIDEAMSVCKELKDKGYKVFVQPVGLTSYNDYSILKLIEKVNLLNPYSFYIVDTLGTMYKNDLLRTYYLIDNNLNKDINIGFHSHNNLQLSFSNAQELAMIQTTRTIIIDSSVFGMGRGAGNLCTELLAEYINNNIEKRYNTECLLEIIDDHLNSIYAKYPWGYSAPYCLAAINNCHPNYASYLMEKQTITVKSISDILKKLDNEKRSLFDKKYIEEVYIQYQKNFVDDSKELEKIKKSIGDKKVLILAPGKSIEYNMENINEFIEKEDLFVISINFIPRKVKVNSVFISNYKRFENIEYFDYNMDKLSIILTSNIMTENKANYSIVNYSDLLVDESIISDNAGLMLINLLKRLMIREVYIAGFDGYSIDKENYVSENMELVKNNENIDTINEAIKNKIKELKKNLDINFITESKYN